MAPRYCYCTDCVLGTDDFDRANSADPGPKWKIISGTGDIVSNHIEVSGIVATRICHPAGHDNGSYIARFDLVNCRTVSTFRVGCGDPTLPSPYEVKWEFSGMDGGAAAKIKITVTGDTIETYDHLWPIDPHTSQSADSVAVSICYEPGALLRGSVGVPPAVDACIAYGGAACYDSSGDPVGGFFWKEGHFDNWDYQETILDNFGCDPCGCFCFKREGVLKEWSCYPETLYLNFTLVSGTCSELDNISIAMVQGNLSPGDGYPQKKSWYSEVQTCDGNDYAFVLDCTPMTVDGTNWFIALSLRLTDNVYTNATTLFNWVTPSINLSTRDADYATSTCEPLLLNFPGLKVNSFFGNCGDPYDPGRNGFYVFCCPSNGCSPTPQYVELALTVTT